MSFSSETGELWRFVLRQFLPDDVAECRMRPAPGGFSGDPVIRIDTADASYALRSWPLADWPVARVRERHRWLHCLLRERLPVSAPLRVRSTPETMFIHRERLWQLEPWLPGTPASSQTITSRQRRSCLQQLARIHQASAMFQASPAGRDWFQTGWGIAPGVEERRRIIACWTPLRLQQVREWSGAFPEEEHFESATANNSFLQIIDTIRDRFEQHAATVDRELQQAERMMSSLFPCFRDLWSAHVLFQGEEVAGFIDPTAARTEHVASDLSRLLGSLYGDDRDCWRAALRDYEQVRPLTEQDQLLIRIFDRSSVLLSGMTWIERLRTKSVPVSALDDVLSRLQFIAHRSLEPAWL